MSNKKIHYTIYKITNKINGRFYIGCHKTVDLNDGYMGSGKYLKRAISKYGIENFEKELLFVYDTPEKMFEREESLITESLVNDVNCYNLKKGGSGGFDHENLNSEIQKRKNKKSLKRQKWLAENDPDWVEKRKKRLSKTIKKQYDSGIRLKYYFYDWRGKKHTEETKIKMSKIAKERLKDPTKNSQYGTMWITNGNDNKKIKKESEIPYGWMRGRIV